MHEPRRSIELSTTNGDLIRNPGRRLPAVDRKTGRELQRISNAGIVEAYEIEVDAALYQRRQDHADLATLERIHSAGILMGAAEAAIALNPRSASLVNSALSDWDFTTGRNYRRTFS
jgi:hypothetical protein